MMFSSRLVIPSQSLDKGNTHTNRYLQALCDRSTQATGTVDPGWTDLALSKTSATILDRPQRQITSLLSSPEPTSWR